MTKGMEDYDEDRAFEVELDDIDRRLWSSPKALRPKQKAKFVEQVKEKVKNGSNCKVLNKVLYYRPKDVKPTLFSPLKSAESTLTNVSSIDAFSVTDLDEILDVEDSIQSHWNKVAKCMHIPRVKFKLDARFPQIDYVKGEFLGRGSFSTVYSALDILSNSLLALKIIPFYNNEKLFEKVKAEFLTISALKHENIISYKGLQFINDQMNLVVSLEYVHSSLRQEYFTNGAIREGRALRYILDALRGLEYLHSKDIVHRDIKCSNLLLTSHDRVKITDFDSFVTLTEFEDFALVPMRGSLPWMSPDILKFWNSSSACFQESSVFGHFLKGDVWSLGCSFLEMYSAKRPYSSLSSGRDIKDHLLNLKEMPKHEFATIAAEDFFRKSCSVDVSTRLKSKELLEEFQWMNIG